MPIMTPTRTRDGGNTIVRLVRELVNIVQFFAPYLISAYGENSNIAKLIAAITALAPLLPSAAADVIEYGGFNDGLELDPANIAGATPDAPAAPALPV